MSIATRPYTFRSRLPTLVGIAILSALITSQPAMATTPGSDITTHSFAKLLYFQEQPENPDELALDSSTKTPLLDEIPGYAAGVAQQISLNLQRTIYFKVQSDIHPFAIKEISGDSIVTQIASSANMRIVVGHTASYDANHDDHDDIAITLNTISGDAARLTVQKLPQEAMQHTSVNVTPFTYFKWGILVALFAVFSIVIIMRTKKKISR